MSHTIFFIKGYTPTTPLELYRTTTATEKLDLSDSTFSEMWDIFDFGVRELRIKETGEFITTGFYTTIHDKTVIGLYAYELELIIEDNYDDLEANYKEQRDTLSILCDKAIASDQDQFLAIF